jgi:hypothetical protein
MHLAIHAQYASAYARVAGEGPWQALVALVIDVS